MHIQTVNIHLGQSGLSAALLSAFFTKQASGGSTDSATAKAPSCTLVPPSMGEYWPGQGGRYICTLPALLGLPARHLIVGETENDDLTFGPNVDVPGAKSQIDGMATTAALLASDEEHPAAKWAKAYRADGHTDFHLPARLDMLMAFICAPQLFKKRGWYWTSTQDDRGTAFVQDFEDGDSGWISKDSKHRVRAFRWIPLEPLNT